VTAVSSLLQGDSDNAATATKRFFINTTVGLGGTSDPAAEMGLEQRKEDLGQAFGANGVAPGPHLVLPIIGPSNIRDVTGDALTALVNPLPLAAKAASSGVNYSNNQDEIKSVTEGALDPYIVERDTGEPSCNRSRWRRSLIWVCQDPIFQGQVSVQPPDILFFHCPFIWQVSWEHYVEFHLTDPPSANSDMPPTGDILKLLDIPVDEILNAPQGRVGDINTSATFVIFRCKFSPGRPPTSKVVFSGDIEFGSGVF
jgi:hypothetical protein